MHAPGPRCACTVRLPSPVLEAAGGWSGLVEWLACPGSCWSATGPASFLVVPSGYFFSRHSALTESFACSPLARVGLRLTELWARLPFTCIRQPAGLRPFLDRLRLGSESRAGCPSSVGRPVWVTLFSADDTTLPGLAWERSSLVEGRV